MDAGVNSTHPHIAEMTSSSPADSVVSAVASFLGNLSALTLLTTILVAIVVYDQGTHTDNPS